ncbi:hemerythrin domain-containing protein [Actinokineospora globicatena]|uniref:hemerythrin domain-containing protein n=1 Tax=Actinokineospora globicatena TaxID=103729 RepID=UPI002555AE09|nr:hemerythrin domain-containing protein [Actinokineospora globicatena]
MGTPGARLVAFGDELVRIHQWLREELAQLRGDVGAYLDGRGERPRELKAHCLSFCTALTKHHTGEDAGAFPVLAKDFPDLRPIIVKLEEDHQMVSSIVLSLEQLINDISDSPDEAEARRVRGELDGLTAILESHFIFEEGRIVKALNELTAEDGTTESLLGLSAPTG